MRTRIFCLAPAMVERTYVRPYQSTHACIHTWNSTYACVHVYIASVPGLPRYAIYCARLIVRGRETLKTGKAWDEASRAHRRAGSRAPRCLDMYTLASVQLLSFWLTATCSSAVKAYTYAYHTCVKRSQVYTFIHSCSRGNGARATRRLPNVYGHVMFHPRPSPLSIVSLPRTIKRAQ